MHQITSKVQIVMILTIIMVGFTASSSERRSSHHTRRVRHHRSNRSSNNNSDLTERSIEFTSNLAVLSSNEWKCGTPKPKLVYINEALGGEPHIQPHMSWAVTAVVLHRCDNTTGCCVHNKSCTPVESHPVRVTFQAHNRNTDVYTYPVLRFSNHTRCECT